MPGYPLLFLFILFSTICTAQDSTSQWTWMHGDVTIPEYAIYGQRGVASKNNTPGPRFGNAKWTDKAGRLWVFGGQSMDPEQNRLVLNDLWQYDLSSNEWTWISGDSTTGSPPVYGIKGSPGDKNDPGSFSGGAYWTDSTGNFWLYSNVLWKYNPATYQWTWVSGDSLDNDAVYGTKGVPGINNTPGSRYGSASWIDKNGNLWLFGNGSGYANDLWKYDPAINMWAWMKGDSVVTSASPVYGSRGSPGALNTPNARSGSISFTDKNGDLWLFGGYRDNGLRWPSGFYNDLWKYNIPSNQWTWVNGDSAIDVADQFGPQGIPSALNKPGGNAGGYAWLDALGNFWLQGGSGNYNTPLAVFWKYDPSSGLWTWKSSGQSVYGEQGKAHKKNYPGARYSGSAWTDPSGNFWLFGGNRNHSIISVGEYMIGDLFNDLWKYDLSTGLWTWMKGGNTGNYSISYGLKGIPDSSNTPGPRRGANTWIDASDNLWLFGSDNLNDLWKYNAVSNTWTWIMGDSVPYPANGAGIFGTRGVPAAGNLPPMRDGGASWKDNNGNFWMYGGISAQPFYNSLNDLWKYDPLTGMWAWMHGEKTVDNPPLFGTKGIAASANTPGSLYSCATWIDKSGNLWLFGGSNTSGPARLNGFFNDLWKYDITTNQWAWIQGDDTAFAKGHYGKKGVASAANRPGARYRSAYWTDPDGKFWLFGGQVTINEPSSGSWSVADLNDLWKYDPAVNQWTWMHGDTSVYVNGNYQPIPAVFGEKGKEDSLNTPGAASFDISGSWVSKNGSLWLFQGGALWRYNRNTNRWAWTDGDSTYSALSSYGTQGIHSAGDNPGSRFSGISWTDSKNNFWLYSGAAIEKSILVHFEDLWRFSPPLYLPGKDSTGGDTTVIIGDTTMLATDIRIFPNPFKNIVSVNSSPTDSVAFIKVYAINGLALLQLNTLSPRTDINMSYYPAGVYVIVTEDKNHKKIGKNVVIKQ